MRSGTSPRALIERRLLGFAPGVRSSLWLAVALGLGSACCVLAAAIVLADVIAGVFLDGADLADALPALAVAALLACARALTLALQEVAAQRGSGRLRGSLRRALTAHIGDMGPIGIGNERSGELVTAMTAGLDDLDVWATSYQPARRLAAIVPVVVVLVVLLLDPPTALVLLLTGPVLVLLLAVIGSRTRVVAGRRAIELRWLGAFFLDMLQGLATLRMFGRGRDQVEAIRTVSARFGETTMDVLRTAFQTALVLEWGAAVATAVVAVEVSLRLIDGHMPFDRALAVLVITPEFFLPLRQLAIRYHSGAAGQAAGERVFAILDTPVQGVAPREAHGARGDVVGRAPDAAMTSAPAGDIRFEDVWFSYDGRGPALQGMDMTIPAGSVVALKGPSGAGKSTCASLLLRFIEPSAGRIVVGGTSLATLDRPRWLSAIAWVPQRPHLFHGTVADNLRLARPGSSDEEVRAAARAANAADFIEALPEGYGTHLGEDGVRLSGGQRQRLAIARAFLKDAPFLVLDEATSHLDAASEAAIGEAIPALVRGRTVLIISHRDRFAALADRTVTLADGRVVETEVAA